MLNETELPRQFFLTGALNVKHFTHRWPELVLPGDKVIFNAATLLLRLYVEYHDLVLYKN